MNAPYDGDRGQGAGGAGSSGGAPRAIGAEPGAAAEPPDPYLQDAYDHDPYRAQDLAAQDPVAEALYDRAAHPPPPPAPTGAAAALPAAARSQYAPDPRVWAQTPPPEPAGPSRYLPYGDDRDDPVRGRGRPGHAGVRRTQGAGRLRSSLPGPGGLDRPGLSPERDPARGTRPREARRAGSGLLKSSAVMAAGTLVSRLTGFVRSLVIVAALGAALLGDSFNSPTRCRR